MGQYGNQPDFGTRAKAIVPTGLQVDNNGEDLKSAALYIGTGGTLCVNVVGGNEGPVSNNTTVFKNIPNGTFFPIIVNNVWTGDDDLNETTCSNIVALY